MSLRLGRIVLLAGMFASQDLFPAGIVQAATEAGQWEQRAARSIVGESPASCASLPGRDCLVAAAARLAGRISDPVWRGYSFAACAVAGGGAQHYLGEARRAQALVAEGDDQSSLDASMAAMLGDFAAARAAAAAILEPARRSFAYSAISAVAQERASPRESLLALDGGFAAAEEVADPWSRALAFAALVEPALRPGARDVAHAALERADAAARLVVDGWMRGLAVSRIAEGRAALGDAEGAAAMARALPDAATRDRGLSRVALALAISDPLGAGRIASSISGDLPRGEALAAVAAARARLEPRVATTLLAEARRVVARAAAEEEDGYDLSTALQRIAAAEWALGDDAGAASTLAAALDVIADIPEERWRAQALGEVMSMASTLP